MIHLLFIYGSFNSGAWKYVILKSEKSLIFFAALAGLVVVLQLRSHRRHQLHFLAKEQQLARGGGFLPSQFNSALQAQHPLLRSKEKLSLSFLASGLALCLPAQRIPSRSVETIIHCQHWILRFRSVCTWWMQTVGSFFSNFRYSFKSTVEW